EGTNGAIEPILTYRKLMGQWESSLLKEAKWGWRAALKIPVGSPSPAISSGNYDAGLGIMLDGVISPPISGMNDIGLLINLGAVAVGESEHEIFPQHPVFFSGSTTLEYGFNNQLSLIIQFLLASPRYYSTNMIGL